MARVGGQELNATARRFLGLESDGDLGVFFASREFCRRSSRKSMTLSDAVGDVLVASGLDVDELELALDAVRMLMRAGVLRGAPGLLHDCSSWESVCLSRAIV